MLRPVFIRSCAERILPPPAWRGVPPSLPPTGAAVVLLVVPITLTVVVMIVMIVMIVVVVVVVVAVSLA